MQLLYKVIYIRDSYRVLSLIFEFDLKSKGMDILLLAKTSQLF